MEVLGISLIQILSWDVEGLGFLISPRVAKTVSCFPGYWLIPGRAEKGGTRPPHCWWPARVGETLRASVALLALQTLQGGSFSFLFFFLSILLGTSLVGQWLRLCASKAGGAGSIPGQGTKISHTLLYHQ